MEESLQKALELRRSGNLQESNGLLTELAEQYAESALVHYECAWSYDILADEEQAIRYYEQALRLDLSGKEAINAYAQLGSMYRLHDRLADSEKILMKGINRFMDAGLLKTFYAFTMYDLGNPGKAMRWMSEALLNSASDPGILVHRRAIVYLGSNLDVKKLLMEPVASPPEEGRISSSEKTIVEKVETTLKAFDPTHFHGGWGFEFDHYEQHFTDPDDQTRRAAVAAFAIMVGVWETQSGFAFTPQHERKYSGGYNPTRPHFELNGYVSSFYVNFPSIQQEFPVMTAYIVRFLNIIDERGKIGLEHQFPEMDQKLFQQFRAEILQPIRQSGQQLPPFEDFLREIGWKSSYRNL